MTETAVDPQPPVVGYFAYWIRQLRLADELPPVLANRQVRAAIHAAPPSYRPPPVEAWMFELATDHDEALDCGHLIGWLRLRRILGDDAGVLDPETARYWYGQLGAPPRSRHARWVRTCRAVAHAAEPRGFGLPPRLVAAFGDHPAWTQAYLRSADFKAMLVAADDPKLAVLPPPPSPWPTSDDARRGALPITFLP